LKAVLSVGRNGTAGWDLLARIQQLDSQRSWIQRKLFEGISGESLLSALGLKKTAELEPSLKAMQEVGYLQSFNTEKSDTRMVLTEAAKSVLAHESMAALMETLSGEELQAVLDLFIKEHEEQAKTHEGFIGDLTTRYQAATTRLNDARNRQSELEQKALQQSDGKLAKQAERMQPEIEMLASQATDLATYLESALLAAAEKETEQQRQRLILADARAKAELRDIGQNYAAVFKSSPNKGPEPAGKLVHEVALSSTARKYVALGEAPEASAMVRHELGEMRVQRALEKLQRVKTGQQDSAAEQQEQG
jgi:hypothetical protein